MSNILTDNKDFKIKKHIILSIKEYDNYMKNKSSNVIKNNDKIILLDNDYFAVNVINTLQKDEINWTLAFKNYYLNDTESFDLNNSNSEINNLDDGKIVMEIVKKFKRDIHRNTFNVLNHEKKSVYKAIKCHDKSNNIVFKLNDLVSFLDNDKSINKCNNDEIINITKTQKNIILFNLMNSLFQGLIGASISLYFRVDNLLNILVKYFISDVLNDNNIVYLDTLMFNLFNNRNQYIYNNYFIYSYNIIDILKKIATNKDYPIKFNTELLNKTNYYYYIINVFDITKINTKYFVYVATNFNYNKIPVIIL